MTADPGSPVGFDADVGTDLAPDGRSASGVQLVQSAMLHRLQADTLPLIGAPGGYVAFGVNVRRWVGEATMQSALDAKGPLLSMVLGRDPRIDAGSIVVSVTKAPPGTTFASGALVDLLITISARTTTGLPISLVFGVSAATVELLAQGT